MNVAMQKVEEAFQLELYRAQVRHERDIDRLEELIVDRAAAESAANHMVDDTSSTKITEKKVSIEEELLGRFDGMQKSLYKQFRNMFQKLPLPCQQQRLDELRSNLSGQPPGPVRDQQNVVLQLLGNVT